MEKRYEIEGEMKIAYKSQTQVREDREEERKKNYIVRLSLYLKDFNNRHCDYMKNIN